MTKYTGQRYFPFLVLGLLVVILPVFFKSNFGLSMLTIIGIYSLICTGLVLLFGFGGQVSLGHAAFFGLGAYSSAILTTRYALDPWLALVAGALVSAGMAAVLSIPASKLHGLSVALVTLGFNVIVFILTRELWQFTGGPSGIVDIPPLRIGQWAFRGEIPYYYVTWVLVWLGLVFGFNLADSRVGLTLKAQKSSQIAAEALGVDTLKLRGQIMVLSGVYASLAGSVYAHYLGAINPAAFGVPMSIEFILMVVLGGSGTIWGGVVGAVMIYLITEVLRKTVPWFFPEISGEVEMLFLGVILVLILLFVPEGLVGRLIRPGRKAGERGSFA